MFVWIGSQQAEGRGRDRAVPRTTAAVTIAVIMVVVVVVLSFCKGDARRSHRDIGRAGVTMGAVTRRRGRGAGAG